MAEAGVGKIAERLIARQSCGSGHAACSDGDNLRCDEKLKFLQTETYERMKTQGSIQREELEGCRKNSAAGSAREA